MCVDGWKLNVFSPKQLEEAGAAQILISLADARQVSALTGGNT